MTRRPSQAGRAALAVAVLVLFQGATALPAPAQFVTPEGSDFHNGSTLPLEAESAVIALVRRLEQALAVSDPDEVVYVVRSLRARPEAALVPFGPRTHLPALEKAVRLVVQRGSEEVRARVEADAEASVQEALRFRDLDALLEHAARGTGLDASRGAALAAARLLFESGRWWECASLAERASDLPGAAELAEAARERLAQPAEPPHPGPWALRYSFNWRLDEEAGALPFVADAPERGVLVQDTQGLFGLDLRGSLREPGQLAIEQTFSSFLYGPRLFGPDAYVRARPAPRHVTHDRIGTRLVLPFNLPVDALDPTWRAPPTHRDARLLALDLGPGSPFPAWRSGAKASRESTAFGPVRIVGDRVFVQLFHIGLDTQVSLAAFDLATGAPLFETPLVRGSFVPRFASRNARLDVDDLDKRGREGAIAERQGIVYACTGFGVVAAVDGLTGHLRYTFRYDRLFSLDRNVYDAAFLYDTGGWQEEPVRLSGERVVVAPSDSRFLYMLAHEPGPRGHLIREDPIERLDRVHVVALLPDDAGGEAPRVVATRLRDNRTSVVVLDANGHVLEASPSLPAWERQRGRPLMVGRTVLVPTDRGVRQFALDDLRQPSTLLAQPPGLPAVQALHAVRDGLVGLCPTVLRARTDPALHVVYWEGM